MKETNIANRLFSDSYKYESWVNLEKEIVNFFFEKGKIDDLQLKKASDFLNIGTFEVLGLLKGDEHEFERFSEIVFSKGPFLKSPYVVTFLDKYIFEGTSISLALKSFNDHLCFGLSSLLNDLKKIAEENKNISQIGRTHGVHAEPTSLGHKFLICYSDIERCVGLIASLRKYIEIVCINHSCCWDSDISLELQDYLSSKFDLHVDTSFSNVCFRERYVRYFSLLNSVSQNIYKLFLDLKLMIEDEMGEVSCVGFDASFGKIENYSRIIESNTNALSSLINVYGEDEFFNKSLERKYFREITSSLISLIDQCKAIFSGLKFNAGALDKNLEVSKELIYSQALMLHILKKGAFSRDEVLEDLKYLSIKARSNNSSFLGTLLDSLKYKSYISKKDVDAIVLPSANLKNIDLIYGRAFGKSLDLFKNVLCEGSEIEEIIDRVSRKLNDFYGQEREPVSVIVFSDRSLFVLGFLLTKMKFPVTTIVFSSNEVSDCGVDNLVFDISLIQSRRVLIVDYSFADSGVFLNSFISKLKEAAFIKDVRVFCLLKERSKEEFKLGWWGKEVDLRGDYAGFGKDSSLVSGLSCSFSIGVFL